MMYMAKLSPFFFALLAFLCAPVAQADVTVSLSAGSGWQVEPDQGRIPTNLMLAPGLVLIDDFLRFELGLVADLGDVEASPFDIQVRPMLVIDVPVLPLYGRVTTGVTQLTHGPIHFAFGGSVGLAGTIGPATLFAEAGYVPKTAQRDFVSIFEGRAGVALGF